MKFVFVAGTEQDGEDATLGVFATCEDAVAAVAEARKAPDQAGKTGYYVARYPIGLLPRTGPKMILEVKP